MIFGNSDPSLMSMTISTMSQKGEDPTVLLTSTYKSFFQEVWQPLKNFFRKARKTHKRRVQKKVFRKATQKKFAMNKTNFELLAVSATSNRANLSVSKDYEARYSYRRFRSRSAIGVMAFPRSPQLALPLNEKSYKRVSSVLNDAEQRLKDYLPIIAKRTSRYSLAAGRQNMYYV